MRSGGALDLMNRRFSSDDLLRMDASARIPRPIDLAHTPPFRLGAAQVLPATRQVVSANRSEVLEPLVMQVLVALRSAHGETLSRDDLIDSCWGGRAVTDDALNRVLSRLRALARDFGHFRIETITKVGYRLVESTETVRSADGVDATNRSGQIGRRTLVAGGAVAAMTGVGLLAWQKPWKHRPPPEAQELFRQGEIATREGFAGQQRQAISYFEQAVKIDPSYSEAWGALALANTHLLEGFDEAEIAAVPRQLRSAAEHALAIDPENADAQFALALVRPNFRNWVSIETELRRLIQRYPNHWLGPGRLAGLLSDVGRLNEAVETWKELDRRRPMPPVGQAYLANGMLTAGQLDEANELLDWAYTQWPSHPALWHLKYRLLLYSGRPQAAAAFAMDPDRRPTGLAPDEQATLLLLAQAADSRRPSSVEASIAEFRRRAEADIRSIPFSATVFALLERFDLSFAAWERYFFNKGTFGGNGPISSMTRRSTHDLFSLPMAPFRSDPRFAGILQRTGLEDYWHRTGSSPDYRRIA